MKELHFVVRAHQDNEVEPALRSYIVNNGDGSYTPNWNNGDQLGAFLGSTTITNSVEAVDFTLVNTAADGALGVFEGSTVAAGSGTFQAFYPSSAFVKGYADGGIGLNIGTTVDYIQHPSVGSPDPASDVLLSKACDYESDGSTVVIDDLYFIRPLSVLKINLKGSYADGEEVSWLKFSSSSGTLSGRVNFNPSTAEINSWPAAKQYAWAEYSSSKPVINHATDNTVYLVVNPCTLTTGTNITVTGETAHLNINKSFDLIADMTFPAGNIAVLNLTINAADCSLKASEDYTLVTTSGAFEAGAKYVFAFKDGSDGHYVFLNSIGSGTNTNPNIESNALTVSAGVISSPNSKYVFTAETGSEAGTFKFKNSEDNYIYNSGSSTTLNTNNGSSADWLPTFLSDSKTYKLQVGSSSGRYMSYGTNTYSAKAYDPVNNAFIDQVDNAVALGQCSGAISVFKYVDTRTPLATPTNLAVSDMTVTWDAVANAGSYTVTIDGTDYVAGTNSYVHTGAAGYYDVEVIAHPTLAGVDTYKDSDAATLDDATFGTPTIATPELVAGVVSASTVTVTWTDDPNATNGYLCEIYEGLTKLDAKTQNIALGVHSVTFSGLTKGTEYTVKVNGKAVTGAKPYAASAVASINMTPAGVTVSSVTAAGSYNITDLTVMAVSGRNIIAADPTGAILIYASSGHGFVVNDVITVNGSVVSYHGVWEFSGPTITKTGTTTAAYPSPVSYTESKITSYTSSPVVEYATATGVANNAERSVTVGSKVLNVYGSLASVDGKQVIITGYAFGYNADKVDFMLVGAPVVDPSVPSLTTDPVNGSSLVWADDEYGVGEAKTIGVTLNGAATGYTVSSGNAAWTVSDNGSGTITVYPNAANASTTDDKTLDVTITHKDNALLTSTITLKQSKQGSVTPTTYRSTLTSKSWDSTGDFGWTSGKDGAGYSNNGIQVTNNANYTGANGTTDKTFTNVSSVVVTYNTNKSAGAGTLDLKVGTNSAHTGLSWGYSGSSDGRTANFTATFDLSASPESGAIQLTANTTTNSIYIVSVAVTATSISD